MENKSGVQAIIYKIGINAYKFYRLIATSEYLHFTKEAVIMPSYFSDRKGFSLEPYIGVMQPAKDVVLDLMALSAK